MNLLFLLCCISTTQAFAASDTLTLKNTGAGYVMGGVYTSPYGVSINGSPTPTLLICDDFLTNISIGQTWTATQTTLGALQVGTNPAGTPKFTGPNEIYNYATAAVLASELLSLGNLASEAAGELSYAIWGIFDPTLLTANPASGEGHLTSPELSAAQTYLANAQAVVNSATTGGVIDLNKLPTLALYTPDPLGASQEFLSVAMPEPGSIALLGFDLLGLAGMVVVVRRKMKRSGK
jgi:hypothetical protein